MQIPLPTNCPMAFRAKVNGRGDLCGIKGIVLIKERPNGLVMDANSEKVQERMNMYLIAN